MKFLSKYIAALVILSLVGVFTYQAYWLTGLYRSMKLELEQHIFESMRMSDYNEMMLRVKTLRDTSSVHGNISVARTYHNTGAQVLSTTTLITHRNEPNDSIVQESSNSSSSALSINDGMQVILDKKENMQDLSNYFQRGLHSGLDALSDPNIAVYDSLLALQLRAYGIHGPYKLAYIYSGAVVDSTYVYSDTLAVVGTPGYLPGNEAKSYKFAFNMSASQSYCLWLEPVDSIVLQQMLGILATSFAILIILVFSFWFLIRTILRQKTLEEMKSDFTNNITHELKTPIAVAYAANDALLNFNQAEHKLQRDKYLHICQEQLRQLSRLVEQILLTSMGRRKDFKLHLEELSVKEILEPLIELHKLKANKEVDIKLHLLPDSPSTIIADRTHCSNLISNLIDNAINYSRQTAVVTIDCRKVKTADARCLTEISVTDQGIGIPADKQKYIFDKFYRVPTGNQHNTKGYGLGLFYVKTIMEKHGGSVTVKSEPGKGCCISLFFNE